MTIDQYQKRLAELKAQNVRCWSLDFKGQKPIEFLKIAVFEEEITRNAFHWDIYNPNKIVDWQKNFIFLIGELCGITAEPFVSEKTGKYSYLSKANVFRLLPSGNKEYNSAEYEFDAEIRAEEFILKDEVKNLNNPEQRKYQNDPQKRLAVVEQAKFGRQRADSGAHKRAIMKMLGFPSPKPEYVGIKLFCFRCEPDMENREVRQMYLQGSNPANAVFGGIQRIEYVTPEKDVTGEASKMTETDAYEFAIVDKAVEMGEHKALCKVSGKVIDSKANMPEFLQYMNEYEGYSAEQRVRTLVTWIAKYEQIPQEILNADAVTQRNYLAQWGNK